MDALLNDEQGRWLSPRLSAGSSTMHVAVPRGYPAYARIFHPAERDRPVPAGSQQGQVGRSGDTSTGAGAGEFQVTSEQVSWSTVAEAFGTVMHPLAQFHRLIGSPPDGGNDVLDAAGWRYVEPMPGNLDAGALAAAADHLADHTTTPTRGVAAVWEGWGGLTSSGGSAVLAASDAPMPLRQSADGPTSVASGYFVADGGPGSGILPQDVVNGPVLELPDRAYYLFSAGIQTFAGRGWPREAPWHDGSAFPQSPSILWPDDHSWVLVTEIDWDSTIVAGSRELIKALVADPSIEALPIREGADLHWDADSENRPPDSPG
ncbi:hypothetical protein E4J89_09480 [Arthrobacter sp. CAU 1506]|uniref:hypothetical protein n=1 Tax=Arthrobacter sp. CAU 1506 TaxID=2560052 RepID=UPI0010ABD832|nr:hypothetical protein [Arthrobacter sp. CAU 1506]TJY69913.1 hypothetical protein E4J89_09480 [Arthrobacter sp. CAU 1506]